MLPPLREELSLYTGPSSAAGAPTWSLHDPARNAYFSIDWLTFEILSRWHLQQPQAIAQAICSETPIQDIEAADVETVVKFLAESQLLQRVDAAFSQSLCAQAMRKQQGLWTWLLHHYLFFRVPLWKPDAWLQRRHGKLGFFFSNAFFWLTGLALITGLVLLGQQWDQFSASFVDLFTWRGLLAYGVTLVLVKFAHEMGHALTAKRQGCKVPTMGVAFLVMFPMAYTDVNDVWQLPRRRQRLAVGAAGIATELLIAAWATLGWALLPDGPLRMGLFLLASTTWISTLLINASPFLRFDGYFLLMDWLDMPNLHARASALARWRLREWLFGLRAEAPEPLPASRARGLVWFAYATWVYRLVVFTGIAVLVYTVFPKPLGPFLAAVEIAWFIAMPALSEIRHWGAFLPNLFTRWAGLRTLALMAGLLALLLLPWDTRISGQAVLKPAESFPLIAPGGARIQAMPVKHGSVVSKDSELIRLDQVDLRFQQQAIKAQAESLIWQAKTSGFNNKSRAEQQTLQARLAKVNAELDGLAKQGQHYLISAPFDGRFYVQNPDLRPGDWVGKNEKLGDLVAREGFRVETYLAEADIQRLRVGDNGSFYPESGSPKSLAVLVQSIDPDASRELTDAMLAAGHGGTIAVREHGKALVPEQALFRVVLSVQDVDPKLPLPLLRGEVVIHGQAQAWALGHVRAGLSVIRREAGF